MDPQREWFEKDYYKILGVASDASAAEITKTYRKLAKELHPDSNPGDSAADERFKEVASAYDVIGDEAKRKSYDEVRRMGPMSGAFGGAGSAGGFNFEQVGDLGDLIGDLFGRRQRRGAASERGTDIETELKLDFADAVSGVTVSVPVTGEARCGTCNGSGAKPSSAPRTCATCSGSGLNDENQGLFSFSRPCRDCSGRGSVIDDPCSVCGGRGTEQRLRNVKARIPAGVSDGQRIKLAGRGAAGRGPKAKSGDLYVRVRVKPHRYFGRSGKNLTLKVPITFDEAALGAEVSVPILDDSSVTIRIPPGTTTGQRLRIPAGAGTAGADLIVEVEVVIPQELSEAQRTAVEAFAAAGNENPRAHLHLATQKTKTNPSNTSADKQSSTSETNSENARSRGRTGKAPSRANRTSATAGESTNRTENNNE